MRLKYVRDHARDLEWMLHKHLQLPPEAQLNVLQEQAVNDCVNGSKQEPSWFDRFLKARQSREGEARRFA